MNDQTGPARETQGASNPDDLSGRVSHPQSRERRQFEKAYLAGIIFIGMLLASSGMRSFQDSQNFIRTTEFVVQSQTDLALADELLAHLTELETGLLRYFLTGEEETLERYQAATNRIPTLLTTLRRFMSDQGEQQARLNELESLITQQVVFCENRIGARRERGIEGVADRVQQRETENVRETIRRLIADLKQAEKELLNERQRLSAQRARSAIWLDVGGDVLSVGLLTLVFILLLAENARRRRSEASLARARDELEVRVRERTTELSNANQALQTEVAERRRSERALSDSETRIRAIVNTAVEGVITINEKGIVESMNPAAEKMFGYVAGEVAGNNVSLLMPSPHSAEHDRYIADYVRTGQAKIIGIGREVMGRRKDGTVFPLDLAVSEVRLAGGRMFTGFLRDITERKRAEEQLAELARTLAEKNKELETIVYVASHDLRSPLVNIQGFSKELSRACDKVRALLSTTRGSAAAKDELEILLASEIPEALAFIQAGVAKIDALLTGFLRFSRLGRQAMNLQRLDMAALLATIVRTMDYQIRQAGVLVRMEPLPDCQGDANLVNQVFSNLIDNALKYLAPGRPGIITISGRAENNSSTYVVRDNGIGIAREHQARIFEIFHRLDPSACPGEGLGLTIAQRILERQQGKIWVESEPGVGSAFFVSLPTATPLKDR